MQSYCQQPFLIRHTPQNPNMRKLHTSRPKRTFFFLQLARKFEFPVPVRSPTTPTIDDRSPPLRREVQPRESKLTFSFRLGKISDAQIASGYIRYNTIEY